MTTKFSKGDLVRVLKAESRLPSTRSHRRIPSIVVDPTNIVGQIGLITEFEPRVQEYWVKLSDRVSNISSNQDQFSKTIGAWLVAEENLELVFSA